jgi:hypothetical protein
MGGVLDVGDDADAFYRTVPRADPHEIGLGGALISLVEPHVGHERDFNRWYEDDHFYAGALYMPWLFAGRRYAASHELRKMRPSTGSNFIAPLAQGCYLHVFWIAPGHVDDLATWAQSTNEHLREVDGRIYTERTHVFTHFHDYQGDHHGADGGLKDYQLLDAEFPALVMEILEPSAEAGSTRFTEWITSDYLPWLHSASPLPVAHSVRFSPRPPPAGKRSTGNQAQAVGSPQNLLVLLHFLHSDPGPDWSEEVAANAAYVASAAHATLHLSAPFRPVAFGTDRYVDELR